MGIHYYILGAVVPVTAMVISDFCYRQVNSLWLLLLFTISLTASIHVDGILGTVINIAINLTLLIYLFVGITTYLYIKNRRWTNPLKSYLGIGDIVFMISIAPLFNLREYLFFLIVALCATLIGWFIYNMISLIKITTIPLVGTLGIAFVLYIALKAILL